MLNLKTLRLQNIGRFTSLQTIDFDSLSGLIQVDGQNLNSGGSSGAGKSTLFLALEYLLGLNSQPISILQSRLTKEGLTVSADFDYNGLPLTITRSKKGLIIDLNGTVTEGSSKLAEEELDKIIGMPRDLFRLITHKRQKEGGFFLDLSNKDAYALLSDAKGLSEHVKKAGEIDKDLKLLVDSEAQAKSKLEAAQSGLKSTLEALSVIGEPPKASSFTQKQRDIVPLTHGDAIVFLDVTQKSHMIEKLDLSIRKPTISAQSFDRSRINEIEGSLADLQILSRKLERTELTRQQTAKDLLNSIKTKITVAKYSVNNGERSKKEASKIVAELKTIKDNTCPTCDRSEWITDNIKVKESELLQAFESHKALILAGVSAAQEIVTLEESLAQASNDVTQQPILELIEINKKESELKSELNGLREIEQAHTKTQSSIVKKANDEYLVKVNELSQKQSAELSAINKQISEAKQELTHAENDYKTAEMSAKKYQDTKDMLLCQRFAKEVTLEKAEKALVELKEKVEIVQEAKLLVKSFISCSFDDALISIGDKATSIIRGIPNMATATIQLEGMRETKEGKTKEEVTAVLSVDGEQNVPIKSLSGGERSSVDLAIDLAVIDFLESSTGKGCNFMVLDEPFGGLDSVSIESILELLQSSNLNKKLIIVDHNEIIKEYVQNKIMVTREGDFSTVEVL